MTNSSSLGKKLQYFRKQKGISQVDLEILADAASGSISRFESDKVLPSKPTLEKILAALELASFQKSYLMGIQSSPPTDSEFKKANEFIDEYFNSSDPMAFLRDDMWGLHRFSKNYHRYLNVSREELDQLVGKNLFIELFNPESIIRKSLSDKYFPIMAFFVVSRHYETLKSQLTEQWVKDLLKQLRQFPLFSDIWDKVAAGNIAKYYSYVSKIRVYEIDGVLKLKIASRETIQVSPRFAVIDYVSVPNSILKLLEN